MNWLKLIGIVALAWILAVRAQAEVIELPQEELAKESVLPVFDRPTVVRNRNVVTAGRVDANLSYGLALSEPIYNVNRFSLSLYYNTSENNAFGILFAQNSSGLSIYAKQLDDQFNLDFGRAPQPQQTIMGDWNWKLFYGKMSVTKNTAVNLGLYTTAAGGMVKYQHKSYPAIAAGLGQKFYFSNRFALRFDFRLYAHQAPIPFLEGGVKKSDPVPEFSAFQERLTYTTILDAGLTWLF
jgi:outer membrane beta-barrel protein